METSVVVGSNRGLSVSHTDDVAVGNRCTDQGGARGWL